MPIDAEQVGRHCVVVHEEWARLFVARLGAGGRVRAVHRRCDEQLRGEVTVCLSLHPDSPRWGRAPRCGRVGHHTSNWCCCIGHTPWWCIALWVQEVRRAAAAPQLKLSRKLGLRLGRCVGTDPRELDALFGRCGDDLCVPTPDNPGDPDALAAH